MSNSNTRTTMSTKRTIVHLPKPKSKPTATSTTILQTRSLPSSSSSSSSSSTSSSSITTSKTTIPSSTSSYTQYHNKNTNHSRTTAKQHHMQYSHTIKSSEVTIYGREYLVSDTLYFEVPQSIKDSDIIKLLTTCRPLLIQRNEYQDQYQNHTATGWIRFVNKEQADRAYTLFDGLVFQNSQRFQLYITPNGNKDQVPNAPIFQVNHLSLSMTNEGLYNLFRPFGPIRLCKIIVEKDGSFNGTALLQYFDQHHAENAKKIMNNKPIDGDKQIYIFSLVSNKPSMKFVPPLTNTSDLNSVDYTNLYIKNLDLAVKSADLYLVFRDFGHIISARVMKNPRTKQSRGYGFVSFTRPDDAKAALDQLNGKYILGKPVVIAFHEPKRNVANASTLTPLTTPSTPRTTLNTPIIYHHQHQKCPKNSTIGVPSLPLGSNFTKNGRIDHRYYHASSPAVTTATTTLTPSGTPNNTSSSPPLHISSSSSSSISYGPKGASLGRHEDNDRSRSQRNHVRTAILEVISKNKGMDTSKLDEWVERIMSLRSTSRALCLFNPVYLKTKLEAETIHPHPQHKKTTSRHHHHHLSHVTPKTPNLIQPNDHHSHASSSTISSSAAATASTTTDIITTQDLDEQQRHYSIALFVESIKGLSLLQQKQHLGDLLFPYVKATRTKQASKVTIHLLDTQPLEQLAYSMHSMELLKPLVDKAFLTLTRQQSFIKSVMKK